MASYGYTFTSGDTVTPTKLNNARTASEIVNADIKSDAAIAHSKLANITSGQVLLGNASNVPTATAVTGDVTISNTGVTAISSGVIIDADIKSDAAIAGTKIAPNFGSQNITTTGVVRLNGATGGTFGAVATGVASPQVALINNADANNGPFIVMSKSRADGLADGGDGLGAIVWQSHDGTAYRSTAIIQAGGDGTATASSLPSRLVFSTTPAGSVASTERMRITQAGNVGIGTTSPNAAALVDISSTTKGFLPPRMTTTQRNAIATPPAGLTVYNTTTNKMNFYNGTAWEAITSA